jgi:hypothetical protein
MNRDDFLAAAARTFDLAEQGCRFRLIDGDLDFHAGAPLEDSSDVDAVEDFLTTVHAMCPAPEPRWEQRLAAFAAETRCMANAALDQARR